MRICRPYLSGDIGFIDAKEHGEFTDADLAEYHNYSRTIEEDGYIMAVIGIVRVWNGVGQGFVITDKKYHGGISYVRDTIRTINQAMKKLSLWRLQTYIDERWKESKRFAELLGMKKECRLEKMSPDGHDLFLYKRIAG